MTTLDDAELERMAQAIEDRWLKDEVLQFNEYDSVIIRADILKALKQIRDARLVLPTWKECCEWADSDPIHRTEHGCVDTAQFYFWLCEQLGLGDK
jgi:hypothetical protein